MRLIVALIPLILFLPSPATADWQYTRWGMTSQQVADASKGSVLTTTQSDREAIMSKYGFEDVAARGAYHADSFDFDALFRFKDGGLYSVILVTLGRETCDSLVGALDAKYGKSVTHDIGGREFHHWQEQLSGDSIEFLGWPAGTACRVQYSRPESADHASPGGL